MLFFPKLSGFPIFGSRARAAQMARHNPLHLWDEITGDSIASTQSRMEMTPQAYPAVLCTSSPRYVNPFPPSLFTRNGRVHFTSASHGVANVTSFCLS